MDFPEKHKSGGGLLLRLSLVSGCGRQQGLRENQGKAEAGPGPRPLPARRLPTELPSADEIVSFPTSFSFLIFLHRKPLLSHSAASKRGQSVSPPGAKGRIRLGEDGQRGHEDINHHLRGAERGPSQGRGDKSELKQRRLAMAGQPPAPRADPAATPVGDEEAGSGR